MIESVSYDPRMYAHLAGQYLDILDLRGHEEAAHWWESHLNDELRDKVRPFIAEEIAQRARDEHYTDDL